MGRPQASSVTSFWLGPAAYPGVECVQAVELGGGELEVEHVEVLGDPFGPHRLGDRGAPFLQALARHALGDDFLHLFGLFRTHSGYPLRQRNIRRTGITCTLSHK